MAVFGPMQLTTAGQNLYTKAQTGTTLNFTRMQIGSGQMALSVTLAASLTSGNAYTSLSVNALSGIIESGSTIIIGSQTVTTSAQAAAGATSISINSFTPSATQSSGTVFNVTPNVSSLTALVTPVSYFNINSETANGNTTSIKGIFENTNLTSPTYICEIGLFAQDPTAGEILYSYANAGTQGDTLPSYANGPISRQFNINVAVGNATSITANIPANTYIPTSSEGVANGVATLDSTGKIPVSQIPSTINQMETFSAGIEASQVILGNANNISSPASPILLASANAQGLGMDQYGNLLPIDPAAIVSGNNWYVLDKNGNAIYRLYLDGTGKFVGFRNVFDDGSGNMIAQGAIKSNADNSLIANDTGSYRLGLLKKSGQGPVLAYASGTNFYIQRSSQSDLGDGNIGTATMTTVFGMDGIGNIIMPLNLASTVTGTNSNLTMSANTDTLLPFLASSPGIFAEDGPQWNNGVFTAPTSGTYLISVFVRVNLPPGTAQIKLWEYPSGSSSFFVGPMGLAHNAGSYSLSVGAVGTHIVRLNTNDAIKLYINTSAANTTVDMTQCRATVVKIG